MACTTNHISTTTTTPKTFQLCLLIHTLIIRRRHRYLGAFGLPQIQTAQGTKIVREGPVSFVRRELSMSLTGSVCGKIIWAPPFACDQVVRRYLGSPGITSGHRRGMATGCTLIVDIGVGHGESTYAGAIEHPDKNFLAVEVYRPGYEITQPDRR